MRSIPFILSLFCALGLSAQIRLSEYQTNNYNTLYFKGKSPDWAELVNRGESPVNLKGYSLTDETNTGEEVKFIFDNVVINPGQFLLVYFTGRDNQKQDLEIGFKLRDGADTLLFIDPHGKVIDQFWFSCIPEGKSAGLNENDSLVIFNVPTPGKQNDQLGTFAVELYEDTLLVSKQTGLYTNGVEVVLTTQNASTEVFYSLDGDDVNPRRNFYESAFRLENKKNVKDKIADEPTSHLWKEPDGKVFKAQVMRARGYYKGCPVTKEVFRTYFIDPKIKSRYNVPVFSLISDKDNFFSEEEGIYVSGNNYYGVPGGFKENYWQKGKSWERPVHVEFFNKEGDLLLKQSAGVRVNGNTTRTYPQKSLRLYARDEYDDKGVNSKFDFPFFDDRKKSGFKTLILRTAGADISNTFFKDAICHRLAKELKVDYQSYMPAVVFLNGEYWGIHNLRERQDEHYIERYYGIKEGIYDLISINDFIIPPYESVSGDFKEFEALRTYIMTHDLSQDDQFDTLNTLIDFENFIDYHILQLFVANEDWLNANTKFWKEKRDGGKWRWLFFDCDRCFSDLDNSRLNALLGNKIESDWADWATELQRAVFKNEAFRQRFYARYLALMQYTFTTQNMLRIIDELEGIYEPLANEHIARWRIPETYFEWKDNVNALRTFALYRPLEVMDQLTENFGNPYVVYPNPARDVITISTRTKHTWVVDLELYDTVGRLIKVLKNYTLDEPTDFIQSVESGVYILRIHSNEIVFRTNLVVTD